MRLEMKYVILLMQTDFFNPREHSGLLRTLMLRTASTGDHGIDSVFWKR
jgi:hypothetical protein